MSALAALQREPSPMAPIDLSFATPRDAETWDAFIASDPDGTFFHRFGWACVVRRAYGFDPLYLMAKRGSQLVGVAPLVDVRAPLTGRALISTAFTTGGGILARDVSAQAALETTAIDLARSVRANYVELRDGATVRETWREKKNKYIRFEIPLFTDESMMMARTPRRRRADLRKALALQADGALAIDHSREPGAFYALYAHAMHRLGTPIFPRRFLDSLLEAFRDSIEFSFAYEGKNCVGALLTFRHGARILPYYIGTSPRAQASRAIDLLYWAVMRRGAMQGASTFDFGRSKVGSGAARYKKLWGAQEIPLTYKYHLIEAGVMPDLSAQNPKFETASMLWRRTPDFAANAVGPLLARNFP